MSLSLGFDSKPHLTRRLLHPPAAHGNEQHPHTEDREDDHAGGFHQAAGSGIGLTSTGTGAFAVNESRSEATVSST